MANNIRILIFGLLLSTLSYKVTSQTILDAWIGKWKGTLEIFTPEGKKQSVEMGLHIFPTDSVQRYTWKIIYGSQEARPYEIILTNPEKGELLMDEKNSIFLSVRVIDQSLVSCFEVNDNILTSTYTLQGKTLDFQVTSASKKESKSTGKGQGIPEVMDYPMKVVQKAVLKKVVD